MVVSSQPKTCQQVVASFDGVVTQRNIDVRRLITADATSGTSMFSMVHSDVIRVWVYVPQDDAFGVSSGVEAVIRVPAMPNLTFRGKVTRIADALQPGTRTLLTEIDVPNPDGSLQPGVYCTVELKIPRKSPALIVPASAIIFNQNGMPVAVVEDGVAHLHKIAVTTDYGTEVEVSEGVKDGDKVILAGQPGRWRESADHPRAACSHTLACRSRRASQPLFTKPVVYIYMDRLGNWLGRGRGLGRAGLRRH